MSWTDERIEMLRQLWENGLTASQIADKLGQGLSRNAVIGKAHRLGLKSRPSPVKTGDSAGETDAPASTETAPAAAAPAAVVAMAAGDPPAVRKPAPPRPPVAAQGKSGKTSLLDLSDKICKWPIGHPGEPDFHFCGKPSQAGFPYCSEHCAVAYQAQLPRRDRTPRPLPPVVSNFRR